MIKMNIAIILSLEYQSSLLKDYLNLAHSNSRSFEGAVVQLHCAALFYYVVTCCSVRLLPVVAGTSASSRTSSSPVDIITTQ